MLKSKFFRIGVEGDTADGREISKADIEQMAKTYDPKKYGARVNCEHIRGLSPDGPFGAYGDVVELKTDTVEIDGEQKLALLGSIAPTPELVALNKKGQKVYTSMEVRPDFKKSGESYLVGLAITDSPASLGTEMLAFAAGQETNPLASRKQHPDNLFTAASEASIEFEDDTSLLEKVTGMFSKNKAEQTDQNKDFSQALEAIAGEVVALQKEFKNLKAGDNSDNDYSNQIQELTQNLEATTTELSTLKTQLENEPNSQFKKRPPAPGGDGGEQAQTDC